MKWLFHVGTQGNVNAEIPFTCGSLLRTDLMDLKRHEDDFPQANSQNTMGIWLSKDGHLHSTLTAFTTVAIRLGQQQGR